MKKLVWAALLFALLLQTARCQEAEDLTDDELEELYGKDTPDSNTEAPKTETPTSEEPASPPFKPPSRPSGDVYLAESFTDEKEVWKVWVPSKATKEGADADVAKYDGEWTLESPTTEGSFEEDQGLVMGEAAKHYAIAAKLDRPFSFEDAEAFVVQYEVNFQNGLQCGGAYVKLLTSAENLSQFQDKTPYSIMFGPDKCGATSKIHFIVQFKNPITGEVEEKHSKQAADQMNFFSDKKTHLFTLLIRADGIYHIIVDQRPFLKGSIYNDLSPPIIPPEEIDDPEDRMPEDWDEREKIPDPEAVKPEDWDEDAPQKIEDPDAVKPEGWLDDGPEFIPNPEASVPEDWDEEEDGEYEPPTIPNPACEEVGCGEWKRPMIQNPNYKGKWKPPLIENPDYDGKWSPRRIANPGYFEDDTPFNSFTTIEAIGFELWTMTEDIMFDNIIVCGELAVANNYAADGWVLKMQQERLVGGGMSLGSWLDTFVELANTYPYLWALYAIAVVLPFVCCIGCCCMKSKPDEVARRKKTDAPSPDDPTPKEEPAETSEEKSYIAAADDQEEGQSSQGEGGASQDEGAGSQDEGAGSQEENAGSQGEEGAGASAGEEEGEGTTRDTGAGASAGEEEGEGTTRDTGAAQEEGEGASEAATQEQSVVTTPKKSGRKRKTRRED